MTENRALEMDLEADDNPDVLACRKAWDELRGSHTMPAWSDFDWFAFPTGVLPYFVVADVIDGGADFVYRFWGSAHTEIFHRDYTQNLVSSVRPAQIAEEMLRQYRRVLETGAPCLFMFELMGGRGRNIPIRESSLRLPFAAADGSIGYIVSLSDNRRQSKDFSEFFTAFGGIG